jgi:hypothetical protein
MIMSRLCALNWVIVLYDYVVPVPLKADVSDIARFWDEFVVVFG